MLLIRLIEIENFACFDWIEIEPSTNPERPLTVIRAENGSGKTTLLRAIRWGMYGERGLPGNASHFSLHPAAWRPDDTGVRTRVSILFETDGSSRDHPEGRPTNTTYELRRSATTVAAKPNHPGEPDFRRIHEAARLLVQAPDGSWSPHEAGVDSVIAELLPWDLQDFFVMDADEAADYVGGSENKVIQRQEVIEKTSFVVRALLGLDIFEAAAERIQAIKVEFGRSATKAVRDEELNRKQGESDLLRTEIKQLEAKIESGRGKKTDLADRLERARGSLETLVGSIRAHEELRKRLADNRERRERVDTQRRSAVERLSRELGAPDLLGALAAREVSHVVDILQPLYDDGSIPIRHLAFVQGLLEKGVCVCGEDLTTEGRHRQHVKETLAQSDGKEDKANYLAQVLHAANALHRHQDAADWIARCDENESVIGDLDEEVGKLDLDKRDMDSKIKVVDDEEVQVARSKIETLETNLRMVDRDLGGNQDRLERCRKELNELEGVIRSQIRRQRQARDLEAYQETAAVLVRILDSAYNSIRDGQVRELGDEMNQLFGKMARNVVDDDALEGDRPKATLRMIARVGLRSLEGESGKFEIFALNSRGRSMPPTEINGASRRILALSFVLALCKVSRTHAPLVADSLLNFMSGSVRTNTLRVTAETASQPILLLTGSDLESQSEVELVSEYGGATYTLTGQWQTGGEVGDVVNQTTDRQVSLVCSCGPREFCDVCERHGQAGSPGWTRLETRESRQ